MGKKYPYYGKSMITNFPGPSHLMCFVAISRTTDNWWKDSCISHMMKYIIGSESDRKKYPCYGKSMITNFPCSPPCDGFCFIFPCCGKLMWKPKHFLHDEISYFFPVIRFSIFVGGLKETALTLNSRKHSRV